MVPSKRYADIIVPRGVENVVAIEMLAEHINSILMQRELQQEALNLASKKLLPQ